MAFRATAGRSVRWLWRSIMAGVLGLGALLGVAVGLYWALDTCQPLDRWLGVSGCSARIVVPDFAPRSLQAMVWPKGQDTISLFGASYEERHRPLDGAPYEAARWRLEIARIAFPGGEESGRIALPLSDIYHFRTSADGARVMIDCRTACNGEDGWADQRIAVVSVSDGKVISLLADNAKRSTLYQPFPGEESASLSGDDFIRLMRRGDAVSPDGKYTARRSWHPWSPEFKDVVLSAAGDKTVIRKLTFERRKTADWSDMRSSQLQFSPSGRLIALLEKSFKGLPDTMLHIWDVESGQRLASLRSGDHVASDLLWSWDEKHIILNRPITIESGKRWGTAVDFFDVPAARQTGAS
jgi:hypothetical protein